LKFSEVDEANGIKTIQNAIRNGINFIDTSPWYGQGKSERIIGEALKGVPRQAYYIGTKVGRYELDLAKRFNFTSQKVEEGFRISLDYLGLDYVDIIQVKSIVKHFYTNGEIRRISILC
jgi:L-galactose dehydrogenase